MPIYDLFCPHCDHELYDVVRPAQKWGKCPKCSKEMKMKPTTSHTDVLGSEQWSDVLDISYTSTRERERKMKAINFDPAGDKVGGARNEKKPPVLYSYAGQTRR